MRVSRRTKWTSERSNIDGRYLGYGRVAAFPGEPPSSRINRQCDGSRGHGRRVRTCIVGSGPEEIRGPGIVEDARAAAVLTLKSEYAVSPSLSLSLRDETPGVVYIAGMPDLFRSNNDVFVFPHEEHIMHISTRPFILIGWRLQERGVAMSHRMKPWNPSRRRFPNGHHYILANNCGS